MPFKSDKQREYFFAKLNNLPKGSKEYNKWKKVVDKFVTHSIDESQDLDEISNNLNEELLDEDITSGSIIVYHRTGRVGNSPVKGIAADGYRVGSGDYYGVGVYTTYDLDSQLRQNMVMYGNIIIESKVLSMNKFLIFDYDVAKRIYGNVNYTLENQLKLILRKEWNNFIRNNKNDFNDISEKIPYATYTSQIAKDFYEKFKTSIFRYLRGIVFTGERDGKVLVSYDRKNVEPLRYTTDEGETWTNIINKNIYQRLKQYNPKESDTNYQHFINQLEASYFNTDINTINYVSDYMINDFDEIKKYINSKNIYQILDRILSEKRDFFIDKLLKDDNFMNNIDIEIVGPLLNFAKNRDKIIDIVSQNKNFMYNLDWDGLSLLLSYSSNPENLISVYGDNAKSIINNLDASHIKDLFIHAKQPEKIIEMLGERWKTFTSSLDINEFLNYLKDNTYMYNSYIDILSKDATIGDEVKQILQQEKETVTPMNEIFKSLTSLQKELKEQNLKQKNLEKVKQFLLEKKGIVTEDFKSQEQNYINQGNDPQIVKSYIERFRKIRDKNYRQLNDQIDGLENVRDRKNIDSYKTFKELETIVDYVGGQIDLAGTSLGNDIEIDAKPIYENDVFQIYYADSPRACIKYKGNIPYSWCVSRNDSSNMYYTYRYKETEPSFYFVKIKDRTKKELETFSGQFKDKYHFFVIQVNKGARIGDKITNQYIVTSAMNDGDKQMSWNEIVAIEPRIQNLQEIFKPIELSPEDKEFYNKFIDGVDDNTFCKLDYTSKRRYLEIYVMPPDMLLTDIQFKCLPEDLMNLYVGFAVGLTEGQFELIKSNKNLLKRYQQITEKKLEEYLKSKNENINFNYTELLILPEDKKKELVVNLTAYSLSLFLEMLPSKPKIIDILFNIGGKEFVMNLDISKIHNLFVYSKDPDKIINMILNISGIELKSNIIEYLLIYSSQPDEIIILLGDKGKEFINDIPMNSIFNLFRRTKEPEKIIKTFGDKGKEYIKKMSVADIMHSIKDSKVPDKVVKAIGKKAEKFLINFKQIDDLYKYSEKPEKIREIMQQLKNQSTTPLNEIFSSLTSLQEELTEQRKLTIKESNLMKVQNFIKKRKNNQ